VKGRDGMKSVLRARIALGVVTAALGLMMVLSMTGAAGAQEKDPYAPKGPNVLPSVIERGEPERPPAVEPERIPPEDSNNRLPFTGADITLFAATGMAAVVTGGVILRRTRSRSVN
jgi:hypothetical protein